MRKKKDYWIKFNACIISILYTFKELGWHGKKIHDFLIKCKNDKHLKKDLDWHRYEYLYYEHIDM